MLMYRLSGRPAFDKITSYIKKAKEAGGEVLVGGSGWCRAECLMCIAAQSSLQPMIPLASLFSLQSS